MPESHPEVVRHAAVQPGQVGGAVHLGICGVPGRIAPHLVGGAGEGGAKSPFDQAGLLLRLKVVQGVPGKTYQPDGARQHQSCQDQGEREQAAAPWALSKVDEGHSPPEVAGARARD